MFAFNYSYQSLNNIQIHTTGCDLCIHDGRKFANLLPEDEKAIVFNTCSVFVERETENRILLQLLNKAYPEYKLYVLGCDVNNNPERYKVYNNVYTNEKVNALINKNFKKDKVYSDSDIIYLKIQDGCRHNCSFCIINKLRNNPFSLPYKEILNNLILEIGNRKEVKVQIAGTELTNYYDKETGYRISDVLMHLIRDIPSIKQLVMTSIDPASSEIENIIKVIVQYPNILVPHLNLAVQSGNDYILKQMKRRHTIERVRAISKLAKENRISLGWDIIVGFPGETDEMYIDTLNLVKELKPLTRTMFKYSPRKGTPAYEMLNQIPEDIKEYRLNRLIDVVNEGICKASNEYKNNYLKYINDTLTDKSKHVGLNNESLNKALIEYTNVKLDILNEDELATFIRSGKRESILHINYDLSRKLECDIYINFIKTYLKTPKLVIHVPDSYDIDNNEFEKHYPCIVRKRARTIIII